MSANGVPSRFFLKERDTLPALRVPLFNPDGTPYNATGSTAWKVHVDINGSVFTRSGVLETVSPAVFLYSWVAADWTVGSPTLALSPANGWHMEVEIIGPGEKRLTFPNGGELHPQHTYDLLVIRPHVGQG